MATQTTDLELRIKAATEGLASVQSLADEIDVLGGNSAALRAEASKLSADLALLGRQQAVIDNFKATAEASDKAAAALADLQAKAEAAGSKQAALNGNLETLRGGLDQTRTRTEELRSELQQSAVTVQELTARFGKNSEIVSQAKDAYSEIKTSLKDSESAQKDLEKAVRDDESALAKQEATLGKLSPQVERAEQAVREQADALTQAGKAAEYAGVNTSDLTAEQQRVTRETANAKSAAVDLSNKLHDEKAALSETKAKADEAASSSKKLGDEQKTAGEKAKSFNDNFKTVIKSLAAFGGIQIGGQLVKQLISLADKAKNIDARLRIAAGSSEAFAQAQKDVLDIALQTGTTLESSANLYGRLALAIKATGGNAADAATATRAITEAFAVSGSSAEAANASIVQLAQGLASGTLRGDELNSVLEQAPRLAQAFADSLGISTGELRKLGAEGALTPQLLLEALKQQAPKIAAEFEQIPITVGRAMTNLGTALTVAVGNIDATTGSTTKLGETINDLAQQLIVFSKDAGVRAGIESVGDIVSGTFESIASLYYGLKSILTGAAAATAEAASLIALALSKVTFGDASRAFADAADVLQNRAAELADGVVESTDKFGEHFKKVGDDTAAALGHAGQAMGDYGTEAQATGEATKSAGDAVAAAGDKITLTGQKFVDVAADMAKAAAALHADVGLLTDGISADAQQAADALGTLLTSGQLTADGLRVATQKAIDSAKTVQDLDLIRGAIEKAYADGKVSVEDMRASVERVTAAQQTLETAGGLVADQLGESAKTLGISYDAIANRASAAAATAIKAFADLAASGTISIGGLQQSIDAVLAKLESQKDVEAFQAAIKSAFAAGQISADAYNGALDRSRTLLDQIKDAADPAIAAQKKGLQDLAAAYDERIVKEKEATATSRQSAEEIQSEYDKLRQSIGSADTLEALKGLRQSLNDAYQAGILGAEQYSALVDELNSKTTELQEGLRGVEGFAQGIAAFYDGLYAQLGQMSDAAVAAFRALETNQPSLAKTIDQTETLKQQVIDLGKEIAENQRNQLLWSTGGLSDVFYNTAIHFDQIKQKYTEQQLAVLSWQDQLSGTGAITDRMLAGAEQALRGFNLLDSQTLSGLRGAIDSARQKLDSLRDSAASTLASLNEELAQAQGNLVQAQQLRNEQRVQDLQAQLAAAQAAGDQTSIATLKQALSTLQQINDLSIQSAKKQQQTQQQISPKTPAVVPSTSSSSAAAKKVEVTLHIGNTSVTGDFDDDDAQALLDALARSQSVSTH